VCNGLEAAPAGGAVRVWSEPAGDGGARFHVQSPAVMPPEVQARVFQRSFSTKAAAGRGLGTYGMKLLGERLLGGEVSFVSREDVGTIFTVALPPRPVAA
jgi:signal transduction histidine kinase